MPYALLKRWPYFLLVVTAQGWKNDKVKIHHFLTILWFWDNP